MQRRNCLARAFSSGTCAALSSAGNVLIFAELRCTEDGRSGFEIHVAPGEKKLEQIGKCWLGQSRGQPGVIVNWIQRKAGCADRT